jgi:hypothetical protein
MNPLDLDVTCGEKNSVFFCPQNGGIISHAKHHTGSMGTKSPGKTGYQVKFTEFVSVQNNTFF